VPVFIEKSADVSFAVKQILISKTFDNGTVCCSEQSVVTEKAIADKVMMEFKQNGAHFLSEEEIKLLEKVAFDQERGIMNAAIVGKSVSVIAGLAGFKIPDNTRLLIAPLSGIGPEFKLSSEILAPLLGFYVADDFERAVKLCMELNFFGGIGHTASIFSNDDEKINEFANLMNAGRIVVNMPSSQGGVGGIYNTLHPSLTLGCGTSGKNITTDNITAKHLLNVQRITRRRPNRRLDQFDAKLYLDETLDAKAIERIYNQNY
jgi:acetaldehyde dehydrogenase / alcohol dehydrogenase